MSRCTAAYLVALVLVAGALACAVTRPAHEGLAVGGLLGGALDALAVGIWLWLRGPAPALASAPPLPRPTPRPAPKPRPAPGPAPPRPPGGRRPNARKGRAALTPRPPRPARKLTRADRFRG